MYGLVALALTEPLPRTPCSAYVRRLAPQPPSPSDGAGRKRACGSGRKRAERRSRVQTRRVRRRVDTGREACAIHLWCFFIANGMIYALCLVITNVMMFL